jgi:hypothetical protein
MPRTGRPGTVSKHRAGLWARERDDLADLHRRVVMIRWGKFETSTAKGDGMMWWGPCERCGKDRALYRAHIMPVGRVPFMEFDPDNAIPLCFACHIHWWHKFPTQATEWITDKLGADRMAELTRRATPEVNALGIPVRRPVDYGTVRRVLTQELRRLTEGREPAD